MIQVMIMSFETQKYFNCFISNMYENLFVGNKAVLQIIIVMLYNNIIVMKVY